MGAGILPFPPPKLVPSAFGLVLEAWPQTRSAREKYPPGPAGDRLFRRHLRRLGDALRAAERNQKPAGPGGRQPHQGPPALTRGGKRIQWGDLKILNCAGCNRTLLGPSDECVRDHAIRRRSRAAAVLPPPVAGYVCQRPVCGACLTKGQVAE